MPPAGNPKEEGCVTNSEVLPKEQGARAPQRAPHSGDQHWEDKTPFTGFEKKWGLQPGKPEGSSKLTLLLLQ